MADAEALKSHLRNALGTLRRSSVVIGVSGGIDSSVTLGLAAAALGPANVTAIAMPERENSPESLEIALELCQRLDVQLLVSDITAPLEALGAYERRDAAILRRFPEYKPGVDSFSIEIVQNVRGDNIPAAYQGVLKKNSGATTSLRLRLSEYRAILAASNTKQRLRTLKLYEYAELEGCAVLGTSNWDESYLGFFVKLGDGSWDICMLNESTKSEIWALADQLNLPNSATQRTATTDTFPDGGASQTEMFYSLPFDQLDLVLDFSRGRKDRNACLTALGWSDEELTNAVFNFARRSKHTEWNRSPGIGYETLN